MMPSLDHPLQVFIENEAGSATKNTYDEKALRLLGSQTLSRPYPYHYGFVLNTRSGDGDAVDCFVVTRNILRAGDIVECVPLHLLEQIEDGEIDHKILCVPAGSPNILDDGAEANIRAFVTSAFSHIPGKRMQLGSLLGSTQAVEYIQKCQVVN